MNADDHNAHTLLDFDPLDPEPTGRAESIAYSGEQDYPPTSEAPTVVLGGRTAPLVVLVAILAGVVAALAVFATMTMRSDSPAVPVSAPAAPTTFTATTTTSVAPPSTTTPPPPQTTVTVTQTPVTPAPTTVSLPLPVLSGHYTYTATAYGAVVDTFGFTFVPCGDGCAKVGWFRDR